MRVVRKRQYKHYIEIGPASMLLPARREIRLPDVLPEGVWVLVLPNRHTRSYRGMLHLARRLLAAGRWVVVRNVQGV